MNKFEPNNCECGGEAKLLHGLTENESQFVHVVKCQACGKTGDDNTSMLVAIKEWNEVNK